jgi:WD40 repeat protein
MNALCSLRWLALGLLLGLAPVAEAQQPRVDAAGDPLPDGARLRLGSMRFRSAGAYLNAGSLSPDGKIIAVANGLTIRLVEVATGNEVSRFSLREYPSSNQLYFTADGRQIIAVSSQSVSFYDVAEGKLLRQVAINRPNPAAGQAIALVVGGSSSRVAIDRQSPALSASTSLSADGKRIVQVSTIQERGEAAGRVTVIDLEANKELMRVAAVHNFALQPSLSPDGRWLATWGQHFRRGINVPGLVKDPEKGFVPLQEGESPNRIVQLWDVATGKEKYKLTTDLNQVQTVRFSPDCSKVAAAGPGTIQVWDVDTGKLERRLACRSGQGASVAFSPDGRTLAASGRDSMVQLWDIRTGKRLGGCEGPAVQTTQLQYLPDGQLLAWGAYGMALHIWEAPSGKRLTPQGGHQGGVYGLLFAPDGKTLISAGQDGRAIRWDTVSGKEIEPITLRKGSDDRRGNPPPHLIVPYGAQCAFSPNGKYMIGGASDYGTASAIFELASGMEVFSLVSPNSAERIGPILFSPDSSKVTMLGHYSIGPQPPPQARSVTLWELETGLASSLTGQQGDLTAGGFSTDAQLLVIASQKRTFDKEKSLVREEFEAWVWDIATGQPRTKIPFSQRCTALLFLDERRFLAALPQTGALPQTYWRLYDAFAGKEVGTFEGNPVALSAPPVLSPDRRLVAAGISSGGQIKADGTAVPSTPRILVWEAASGTLRCELTGQQGNIAALAFAPDGRTLATGSSDTTIVLWDLARKAENQAALKPDELDALWKVLDEQSAKSAEQAMRKLAARPGEVIPFLRESLKPAEGSLDAATLTYLVGQLDAGRYATREAAGKRLERVGKPAVEPLLAALKGNPSLELKERIEKLLTRIERTHGMAPWWQSLRGIEVLERIGTPEAKELLAALAKGAEAAPSTRMAAEALERLRK